MKSLGRFLTENEHADHIDENKTNDVLENLQVLTPGENTIKNMKKRNHIGRMYVICVCPVCHRRFSLELSYYNYTRNKNKKPICSAPSCSGKISGERRNNKPLSSRIDTEHDYEEVNGFIYNKFVIGYYIENRT